MADGVHSGPDFRGLFLTYMVIAAFLALFCLLYFNRAFASLVSWLIRQWTWRRYGIYIDIQAIQFSLLGGRIFFVGLRYHGNNETILIQNGHITWSYWLRKVRHIHIGKSNNGKDVSSDEKAANGGLSEHDKADAHLPCRMNVTLAGLEWFVYNRSAAYDSIIAGLTEVADAGKANEDVHLTTDDKGQRTLRKRHTKDRDSRDTTKGSLDEKADPPPGHYGPSASSASGSYHRSSEGGDRKRPVDDSDKDKDEDTLPAFLQLFPIHFICDKAALVMGNENTSGILIFKTQELSGEIDAVETKTIDPYQQVFKIRFAQPVIEIRDNDDYREDQIARAMRDKQVASEAKPIPQRSFFHHRRRAASAYLRNLVPYFRRSVESFTSTSTNTDPAAASTHIPGTGHWQGLSRYLDGPDGDEKTRWVATEYAMLNPILESPEAVLTIYWDSVSKVTLDAVSTGIFDDILAGLKDEAGTRPGSRRHAHNVNGYEAPPAWGINLSIRGGSINYGPWADRKRAELQRVFFPGLSKDAQPAQDIPVGEYRVPTQFKLYVELDEEVTLRVPVREASKNWRFKDTETNTKFQASRDRRRARSRFKRSVPAGAPPTQRPYGWLDIKISANATVSYSMDMVAGKSGFSSNLDLDLPKVEISSSVNQEVLWRSAVQQISCDLSTPLKWNGLRQWRFQISSHDLELFLLRDHVYLLTDLIDDWGTGPPSPYLVFTPFKYFIDLRFLKVKLFLNVNDANIINNPTSLDDNAFFTIYSPLLEASVCIPLEYYRPPSNAIPFSVKAGTALIGLNVPAWNTQATTSPTKDVGSLSDLLVDGKYHYYATTAPGNTDSLILNVSGRDLVLMAHGYVTRYFLKLKDNYFGDDVHFKTLEEYQDGLKLKEKDPEAELASHPPHKAANDMDVMLYVRATDPKVLLPANIYSATRFIELTSAGLSSELRFTNYYMDLDFILDPLSMSPGKTGSDKDGIESPISDRHNTQLFMDGLHVYGNRLFGLPPIEPTYQCNWDISVGAISGQCTTDFLTALVNGAMAFNFTFDDEENALIPLSSIVMYDVTFLRVAVKSVSLWIHLDEAAFLLSLPEGVQINYNDWARSHYSKRGDISIPDLQVSCVNSESAMRHKSRQHIPVETDAFLKTGLGIAIVGRKFDFSNERKLQQQLIRREDQRTHRAGFLLLPKLLDPDFVPDHVDPPAQHVPPVPYPITSNDIEQDRSSLLTKSTTTHTQKSLRHQKSQSSFFTASSTTQSSVVRPQSSVLTMKSRQYSGLGYHDLPHPMIEPQITGQSSRLPSSMRRDMSTSTRSGFYSMAGDRFDAGSRNDPSHIAAKLSSKFYPPYFPFEDVMPDIREAASQTIEDDSMSYDSGTGSAKSGSGSGSFESTNPTEFDLEDIDPEMLNEDRVHSSVMLRVHNGVNAFLNPTSVKHIAALISALQPCHPEDILDTVQISSVDDILGAMKNRKMKGKISDFAVQLPHANLRLLNASSLDSPDPSQEEQDQYDISLSKVTFMSRTKTTWKDTFKPEETTTKDSFQLRLGSIGLAASERLMDMAGSQAAFTAEISDVLVSLGNKDVTYLDADIGGVEAQLSSDKIGYIASLTHRTGVLASTLVNSFAGTLSYNDRVRPLLARRLIAAGKGVPDPTLLVRPSAVLRSANEHLRTFDSWKLAVRLRQIWIMMQPEAKEKLLYDCKHCEGTASSGGHQPPSPATSGMHDVLASLDRWRGWDLDDVSRSVLLRKLFGDMVGGRGPAAKADQAQESFLAVVRLQRLLMMLDPGPRQNEIQFLDLTARFENNAPAVNMPSLVAGKAGTKSVSVLNIFCADSALRVNWDICELAEDVLELYRSKTQEKAAADKRMAKQNEKGDLTRIPVTASSPFDEQTFHLVFAMDHGAIVVDTINLNLRLSGEDIKSSLLIQQNGQGIMSTSCIVSGTSISSRIKSHAELLMSQQLRTPSVLVNYSTKDAAGKSVHAIRATASSQEFSLSVKQDPIVLMEMLDLLVKDEFMRLYQLKSQLPFSPPAKMDKAPKAPKNANPSVFQVKIALFLDNYTISLPLLRSLTYNISGVVARVAVASNFGKELTFDFDVKENSHDMQILTVHNQPRSISLLQIPPTNGRITTQISDLEQTVTVFSSVEMVQLDASAVYSLLSALNRPEISSTVTDMQQQFKVVKSHLAEIFDEADRAPVHAPPAPLTAEAKRPLIYAVHSTFAGLEVFGNSPLKTDATPLARLLFCLDSVKLEMSNRLDNRGPVLPYPELHANLRRIAFEISKGTEDSMVSCGNVDFAALITATSKVMEDGTEKRAISVASEGFDASFSPETVSTVVDVLGYMGDKIKDLDTSREIEYLRKLRQSKPRIAINDQEQPEEEEEPDIINTFLSSMVYSFEVKNIQVNWLCAMTSLDSPFLDPYYSPRKRSASPQGKQDLVLLLERIELSTRSKNSARLTIENFQLQMVPPNQDKRVRSAISALLPEVIFSVAYFSTSKFRRFAFQAVGKSLDLRLSSEFLVPVAHLRDSIDLSIKNVQEASRQWNPATPTMGSSSSSPIKPAETPPKKSSSRSKRLESFLADMDFAGAVVCISGKKPGNSTSSNHATGTSEDGSNSRTSRRPSVAGKYGQFSPDESGSNAVLRSPGLKWKMRYQDTGREDPALYAEVRIDASSNVLYPSVVPLVMDITSSVKEVVSNSDKADKPLLDEPMASEDDEKQAATPDSGSESRKSKQEESILLSAANPHKMLGRLKLNLGIRVCKQQFSLSCQPIARVAATMSFEDVYMTVNTVQSVEQGHFATISGNLSGLQASVQHIYSRESMGSFEVDSMVLSLMNSKHVSGVNGVSAMLKVSPMKVAINAKQLQDFLLFREIWTPRDLRKNHRAEPTARTRTPDASSISSVSQQQSHLVQRYQQVAATAAFPWTATLAIEALEINVDLGQSLGKPIFTIDGLWVSSKKTSNWEQNLCLGIRKVGAECSGRLSGFVALDDVRLRTSIEWPARTKALNETPLIQASLHFSQLRLKVSFDFQAILVADITVLKFLMYNVRHSRIGEGDRLVAIFDCDAVQVFGTTSSAAQGVALYQAFLRLVQERKGNFETSLREIERFTRRRTSTAASPSLRAAAVAELNSSLGANEHEHEHDNGHDNGHENGQENESTSDVMKKSPISLDTDVLVTLKTLNLGVFPNTFGDHQVLKMEAMNAQARFTANIEDKKIHSNLRLTQDQLRIGLAGVRNIPTMSDDGDGPSKTVADLSVDDVVLAATGSRGGTILKVPRVEAGMQTWQRPDARQIDYIFKSALEGKVEVGWNYSRISSIRGMWANHTRALEQTWGRELPLTAIRLTGVLEGQGSTGSTGSGSPGSPGSPGGGSPEKQNKITAEVNVPQSKYEYRALEPAVIETPQLRDMGEATPPLEWIGLHRDRLPNLTHQIVIVSLLELAGEVEDAYARILGST